MLQILASSSCAEKLRYQECKKIEIEEPLEKIKELLTKQKTGKTKERIPVLYHLAGRIQVTEDFDPKVPRETRHAAD